MSDDERSHLLLALRRPRGRYSAPRAAQLSGVPERTVYHWATHGVVVPDHQHHRPKAWSYRDLVFLRLVAFLRSHEVRIQDAGDLVKRLRQDFTHSATGVDTEIAAASGAYAFGPRLELDEVSGQRAFEMLADYVGTFDVLAPLEHAHAERLWGPDLVRPSDRTTISPWVMAGEPVVKDSRVLTASLHALRVGRGLSDSQIVALYPVLDVDDVVDAIDLEQRLRSAA